MPIPVSLILVSSLGHHSLKPGEERQQRGREHNRQEPASWDTELGKADILDTVALQFALLKTTPESPFSGPSSHFEDGLLGGGSRMQGSVMQTDVDRKVEVI